MRRMRELAIQVLIFAVPAALALYGIHFGIRKFYLKPDALSQLEAPRRSAREGQVVSPETIAEKERQANKADDRAPASNEGGWFSKIKKSVGGVIATPPGGPAVEGGAPGLSPKAAESIAKLRDDLDGIITKDGTCIVGEFRGLGHAAEPGSPIEMWARTQGMFEGSRISVRKWITANQDRLGESTAEAMNAKLDQLRAVLDTREEMPDLAWRGIGVIVKDAEGADVIHLSSGFVRLVAKDPKRARWEIVRLMTQTWSPCEFKVFNELASCLKTDPSMGCEKGGYSEAAWAISTALATTISPPGCEMKVFKQPEMSGCLAKAGTLVVRGPASLSPLLLARAAGGTP